METRAAKRKANLVENQNQPLKKKWVALGELPNLTNTIVPQNVHPDKQKNLKNPKLSKATARKNTAARFKEDESADTQSSTHIKLDGPFEIYKYRRTLEMEKKQRPMMDYMEKVQRYITPKMRGILVDWLVEVAEEYKLLPDTLHLSVSYVGMMIENEDMKPS